ncbi:MAG: hypothetical protein AAFX53_15390 [Bacteroidota bacterium]
MELTKRQKEIQNAISRAFEAMKFKKDFKKQFSDSPVKFIKKFTDLELTKKEITEVLPKMNAPVDDLELSETQLEVVAGGADGHNGFTWEAFVYYFNHPEELF